MAVFFLLRSQTPYLFSQHPDQGLQCGLSVLNQLIKWHNHDGHDSLGRQSIVQVVLKIFEHQEELLKGLLLKGNIRGKRQQMIQ